MSHGAAFVKRKKINLAKNIIICQDSNSGCNPAELAGIHRISEMWNPIHWFVIECTDQKLAVIKWDLTAAISPTARHFCGEAHAQTYISRWFESVCVPIKRVLKAIRPFRLPDYEVRRS